MSVAVIGTGNLGSRIARRLAERGVDVVVAAGDVASAQLVADKIGNGVRALQVGDAIAKADPVIFATWFQVTSELLKQYETELDGKVIVDPSNNFAPDGSGGFENLNPDGLSAGEQLAAAAPTGSHFVKAFGTLPADQLDATTTDTGETPVLFYASDDDVAADAAAALIRAAGFEAVQAGGLKASSRIEVFGDLHAFGGLNGRLLARGEALELI